MIQFQEENMKVFFELKKRIHHLKLSDTLPMFQFKVLETIDLNSYEVELQGKKICAMRVNDLFETIHVSRPAMSKVLKDCEKKGYIHRYVSEKDKRYTYVSLSSNGKETFVCAKKEVESSINWMIAQFEQSERESFIMLMNKINGVLEEFEKKGKKSCCD